MTTKDPARAEARKESKIAKLSVRVEELERQLAEAHKQRQAVEEHLAKAAELMHCGGASLLTSIEMLWGSVRELDALKHPPSFDPASLLLLDPAGERMLVTWPLVRVKPTKAIRDRIAGWAYTPAEWSHVADVSIDAIDRFADLFERLGFVDAETGEVVEPAKAYLRGRVNAEPTGRRRR